MARVGRPRGTDASELSSPRHRTKPLAFDPDAHNRSTGSFILIDEATNDTVGAGMIVGD